MIDTPIAVGVVLRRPNPLDKFEIRWGSLCLAALESRRIFTTGKGAEASELSKV